MRAQLRERERRIAAIAARQHGVIAWRQLTALGLGRGAIRHRVEAGRLHPVHRGVYAVGHRRIGTRGRWLAAVLAHRAGTVLSHGDAAALWGVLRPTGSSVHVTVPGRAATRTGIVAHETRRLHRDDRAAREGIPVTSLARTLFDVAEAKPDRLTRAYEEADRLRLLDTRALIALCDRSPGRRALRPIRALVADHTRGGADTRLELEAMFVDFCREHGLPLPVCNVLVEGHLVDATWPGYRLVVELDGWRFHRTRGAFERDRERDAALQAAEYRIIRVTHRRLTTEPAALAVQLRRLLATA